MYEWNECFPQPNDLDVKVWRYLDLAKLVSMLHTRQLYFTRTDRFEDPFEGSSPQQFVDGREKLLEQIRADPQYSEMQREEILQSYADVPETLANFAKFMAVSCWHLNTTESMAMWSIYATLERGIAIQTTYRRLLQCFQGVAEPINIGLVKYIDYEQDSINQMSVDYLFMHKRKGFEHESEVRCLVRRFPEHWKDAPLIDQGVAISADIDLLVENIYVSPTSPEWFHDAVNETLARFGVQKMALKSQLSGLPKH